MLPPHDHEQTGQSRTAQHLTTCMGAHSRHQPSGTKQPSQANNVNSKKVLAPKVPHADPTPPRSITTTHTPAKYYPDRGTPRPQKSTATRDQRASRWCRRRPTRAHFGGFVPEPHVDTRRRRRKMPRWGFPPQILNRVRRGRGRGAYLHGYPCPLRST